ncbi:MAG: hypothetical protein JWN75_1256 [Candidatus Saccharibacteria bacterium]|nr:hypothetical protein [Candidatus Saccharibacteria bacterium]
MATSYDYVTVQTDFVAVDSIVWKYYRQRTTGMVERVLDENPHLARLHKVSPFLPVGTQVRIPVDEDLLNGKPKVVIIRGINGDSV